MGLFGDRDMKKLDTSLGMARVMLSMSSGLGPTRMPNGAVMTSESVMNDVGAEVVPAARRLVAAGRKEEVVQHLQAAKKPGESEGDLVWNSFLDQVIEHL